MMCLPSTTQRLEVIVHGVVARRGRNTSLSARVLQRSGAQVMCLSKVNYFRKVIAKRLETNKLRIRHQSYYFL